MHQETLVFDFAVVFGVAALTIVLTSKLKLPAIFGYLIAGIIVGPYVAIPLFANTQRIEQISELGIILVMFSIGLEFRLKNLIKTLSSSGLAGLCQIVTLFSVGTYLGKLFGWSITESFFLGASLSISSTMIVKRVFDEVKIQANTKKFVFGILVVQDIAAVLILTFITSFALGQSLELKELVATSIKMVLFISSLFGLGILIIPKFVRYALKFKSQELTTIISCGICFTFALLAELLGYSVALGSFIAGTLVAESGRSKTIELNTTQLRSIFSAMFFISVGMTIDPQLSFNSIGYALIVALAIITFQFLSIFTAGVLSGYGMQTSLIAGLSLGQIGEFSFIIASTGKSFGIINDEFYSIIVSAAVLTSISTSLILKHHTSVHRFVESILPKRLQTLILIYLNWFNNSKFKSKSRSKNNPITKNIRRIIFNIFIMITLSSIMSIFAPHFIQEIDRIHLPWKASKIYPIIELIALLPFIFWTILSADNLTRNILDNVWKGKKTSTPFSQLIVLINRLSILFIIGAITMLAIMPFMGLSIFIFLALSSVALAIILIIWKRSHKMQEQIEKSLSRFGRSIRAREIIHVTQTSNVPPNMIPGMDELNLIKIKPNSKVIGSKLSSLNLRALTGATVFSIIRNEKCISLPGGDEVILKNDLIAILGGDTAIAEASKILKETL